jgi:Fic family protein
MRYKSLQKLFNEDASNARFDVNRAEAKRRFTSISSYQSGITLETGELFFTIPAELAVLTEKVLRLERKVSFLWRELPRIAHNSYINDLIESEIISSNRIEGVRSTRRQVRDALDDIARDKPSPQGKKFREFVRLYLALTKPDVQFPKTPGDIRAIYDDIVAGDLAPENALDGKLFRAQPVDVETETQKLVHSGVMPESKIITLLEDMLHLVRSEEIPLLYSAILSHFLFEYIHPFYDGNGRTGRYLLAIFLSEPLSIVTVLSLSKAISENLSRYYREFQNAEAPLNHADATSFLLTMVELIREAQENLHAELLQKREALIQGQEKIKTLGLLSDDKQKILFALLQNHLFDALPECRLDKISDYLNRSKATTRKYIAALENGGQIMITSHRPLKIVLSDTTKHQLGLII